MPDEFNVIRLYPAGADLHQLPAADVTASDGVTRLPSSQAPCAPRFAVRLDLPRRRVAVVGELDVASSPILNSSLFALLTQVPGDAVVDVAAMTFVDAAGLGIIARWAAHQRAVAMRLTVCGASPEASRIFALGSLAHLLAPEHRIRRRPVER